MTRKKKKHKRSDFKDSEIHDALDATDMNVSKASELLGVHKNTLYRWMNEDPNLKEYQRASISTQALLAREKIESIIKGADHLDPRQMGHVISACKIFIDKAEATKLQVDGAMEHDHTLDISASDMVQKLIDDCSKED